MFELNRLNLSGTKGGQHLSRSPGTSPNQCLPSCRSTDYILRIIRRISTICVASCYGNKLKCNAAVSISPAPREVRVQTTYSWCEVHIMRGPGCWLGTSVNKCKHLASRHYQIGYLARQGLTSLFASLFTVH